MLVKKTFAGVLLILFVLLSPMPVMASENYVLPVDITTDAAAEDIIPVAFTMYPHIETFTEGVSVPYEVYGYLLPEGSKVIIRDELYYETVVYLLADSTGFYHQESVWVNGPWEEGNQVVETISTEYIWEIRVEDALISSVSPEVETVICVGSASMDSSNYRYLTEEELANISVGLVSDKEDTVDPPDNAGNEGEDTENSEKDAEATDETVEAEKNTGTEENDEAEDTEASNDTEEPVSEVDGTAASWIEERPEAILIVSVIALAGGGLASAAAVSLVPAVEVSAGIRPKRGTLHVNGDVDIPEIHIEDSDEIAIPVHVTEAEDMNWIIGAKTLVPGHKKLIETKVIPTSGCSAEIKLKWNPDAGKIEKDEITLFLEVAALGIDLHGENNLLEKMVEIPIILASDTPKKGSDASAKASNTGNKMLSIFLVGMLLTGTVPCGNVAPVYATNVVETSDLSMLTTEELEQQAMTAYNDENYELAYSCFVEQAERGINAGYWNLGVLYYKGLYVEQDYEQAMTNWLVAAENGHSGSMNMIGLMYSKGYGVEQDRVKAIEWYERAAAAGHETAINNLVYTYATYNEVLNFAKAVTWMEKKAEMGDVSSLVDLGYMAYKGRGTEQNFRVAMDYFLEAAEKGSVDALFNIGYMYYFGKGVEQDYAKAMDYFLQGADNGHHYSMMYIGFMYACGYGVTQDFDVAKDWAQKLSDDGDDSGSYRIYSFLEEWESNW